jgi:fructose-1,6-bisphosphatase/sedoheptulose 1,7-bisphosphatase-like protein
MARRYEGQVISALRSQVINAATGVTLGRACDAIHANGTGTVVGTLVGDTSTVAINVLDGMYYSYRFQSFDATNGVALVALFNRSP